MSVERLLIVGAGGFGRTWEPAILAAADRVEVVGVVEPDEEARSVAGKVYDLPGSRLFAHLSDRTAHDVGATVMVDSSPFPNRRSNALTAFRAGLDVLAAKPLGASTADARAIVTAADRSARGIAVVQQMRYFPCFREVRRIVADGDLGPPRAVEVEMALDGRGWTPGTAWRLAMRHPLLIEAGIHHFDLFRWCLDAEIERVHAVTWNPPWSPFAGDATAAVLLRTDGGVPVCYHATFAPRPDQSPVRFDSGWRLVFDGGVVTVVDGGVFVDGRPTHVPSTPDPAPLEDLNRELLDEWLAARAAGRPAPFHGGDNLRSMDVLDRALRSADRGPA